MICETVPEFEASKPWRFRFLKELHFRREVASTEVTNYIADLVLVDPHTGDLLKIQCIGVRDIKLGDIEHCFGNEVIISDVRERQLEGITYRVFDEEGGAFSFFCREFRTEFDG